MNALSPDASALPEAIDGAALIQPFDERVHAHHRVDWSGHREPGPPPFGIAFPRTTQEIAAVVRACARERRPIVPQGGMTGLAGGAAPGPGSVAICLQRMKAVREVNRAGSYMVVEAGVPLQRVQEAAAEAGLFFPLDLGARGSALIGGNLSTNAGGNRVLRYGTTRDLTLGLEVVLADGTIVDAMNRMMKNNAGYDLKHLFIGSEGTLGIIAGAVLKLHPKPTTQDAALCALADYGAVLKLLQSARERLGPQLSAFEVMWDDFYVIASHDKERLAGFGDGSPFKVLVETLGRDGEVDAQRFRSFVEDAFEAGLLSDALVAQTRRDVDEFWRLRDASGELPRSFGPHVSFDVSAPAEVLDDFTRTCRQALSAAVPQSRMLAFGHIADGNIHFTCLDREGTDKPRIDEAIYGVVAKFGGSITAEHGIGTEKRAYLDRSRSPAYLDTMRLVKRALDPHGLMNPGKIL